MGALISNQRILEKLQYVAICSMLALKYGGVSDALASVFHDAAMFLLVAGMGIQGFRYVQVPMYLTFLFSKLYWRTETLDNLWLIAIGVTTSLLLYYIWGGFNYDRMKTSGPFDVGYREFTTKALSNDCSVFYPVDKGTVAPTDKSVYYL